MLAHLSQFNITEALFGGALIGVSAVILLLFAGRIAGACGIAFSLINPAVSNQGWRLMFIVGTVLGGFLAHQMTEVPVPNAPTSNLLLLILGGFLTGFGSKLGNGCTSGHGICGIARLSPRSIISTLTFMLAGFVFVIVLRHGLGVI
ncbi:MAG: YeeE/YedE family protein [Gammaproteobacteria bacterium]|nr:YeeE/YedE family protein [Gammaproteobacteria bacterium]